MRNLHRIANTQHYLRTVRRAVGGGAFGWISMRQTAPLPGEQRTIVI